MNKNDKIFNKITDNQLQLLRLDASLRRSILVKLKKLEIEIYTIINYDNVVDRKRLTSLFKEVKNLVDETYQVISQDMTDNLVELVEIESNYMFKTLATIKVSAIKIPVVKIKKLVEGFLIAGAPSEEWWSRQSAKLVQNFQDQIRTGVLLGEDNKKLIDRIRGTKEFGYTNGIMNISRNDAEALVRSSVQTAANQARFEVMESVKGLIKSYRHVSTLDSRTSLICVVRDGKSWDAKTKEPIGHNLPFQVPPLHWNCRSTLIPEVEGVKLDNATRASKDGLVDVNTTFEDYLKGKDKAFIDEVLGVGRSELWRSGKITLRQLLDQSGNPLTLKELRIKYNQD